MNPRRAIPALALAALAVAGCAATRVLHHGELPSREPLVTVIISEDRRVVEEECRSVPALGPIMGCQSSRQVRLPDGRPARAVKIVRYADRVPSEMAAEIEVHELCHAVAALQPIVRPLPRRQPRLPPGPPPPVTRRSPLQPNPQLR